MKRGNFLLQNKREKEFITEKRFRKRSLLMSSASCKHKHHTHTHTNIALVLAQHCERHRIKQSILEILEKVKVGLCWKQPVFSECTFFLNEHRKKHTRLVSWSSCLPSSFRRYTTALKWRLLMCLLKCISQSFLFYSQSKPAETPYFLLTYSHIYLALLMATSCSLQLILVWHQCKHLLFFKRHEEEKVYRHI